MQKKKKKKTEDDFKSFGGLNQALFSSVHQLTPVSHF